MHPTTDNRPSLLLAMGPGVDGRLLTGAHRARLAALTRTDPHLVAHDLTAPDARTAAALAEAELLLTCWGATPLTAEVLDRAPRLRAVVHAAGSVKHHVTDACWERGLRVTSAAAANALPVAEYTLAAILLAGKGVLRSARRYAELRTGHAWLEESAGWGNHRRTVGVVGASRIGRRVIDLLQPFDFEVLLYDPYVATPPPGVELVPLDELCARSTVVSVHAPQLPSTYRMIGAAQLAAMPDGTTLINTSRGSLVDEPALLPHLVTGRLHAILDVTDPELPPPDSPLWTLPNVLLTPHVAGSLGNELHRMADQAVGEVERYVRGEAFAEEVRASELRRSA
ncbi:MULTISPECIES: hydroxyacid dehydrogenase [unclassified Streptomyces]|uniref:hydroxyacid dehydrogenase n=1 Tax=unclassified Streptomyces TaxID=2593676 RepID=UPI0006AEC598|nr:MULTISPECIES: hydroxyacid dehydrogenase [unclassified Streptomyces]KOX22838.1 2-hydroxyacid dehydrogenase [Streptomyces sp. NRRL F-6491]KOX40058.1 2-hydroxyacid dehydrogenase [Streptomyces sp. NRRL F-6492]